MRPLGISSHLSKATLLTVISTGVPQVVLPVWVDLYDFATRAEWLGIGIWGNKKAAPSWSSEELSASILRTLGDGEEATRIRKNARDLADFIEKKGVGRSLAAQEIANLARLPYLAENEL